MKHLDDYRRERDALLARIVAALKSDESIIAAWLAGSNGSGTADNLSDLDLWIVVDDDRIGDIALDPAAFVHAIAPTIMEIHAPEIAPPGGAFLLTWIKGAFGPQEVDWYWRTASEANRPMRTQLLFERRPTPLESPTLRLSPAELDRAIDAAVRDSLQMTFSAAKRARRGDPWTAASQMIHLASCIGKVEWLLEHGTSPTFDDRARSSLPDVIPATVEAWLASVDESFQQLRNLLAAHNPSTLTTLDEPFRSVERWLGAIDENPRSPGNRPGRLGG